MDDPVDDVSVHLSKHEGRIILYFEITLLDGRHWTGTTTKLTWRAQMLSAIGLFRILHQIVDEMSHYYVTKEQ